MGDAYLGAGVERVTYNGVLYQQLGRFCGELPDLNMINIHAPVLQAAYGGSVAEVRATLQGLLEEQVEMLLEEHEALPEPDFEGLQAGSLQLPSDTTDVQAATFSVIVPSTADKDLLTTFMDYPGMHSAPKWKNIQFKAVVLKMQHTGYGGHFPDLPGAFTSGKSVEETCDKLQQLLELYVGGLLKDGELVPAPSFKHPRDLNTPEDRLNLPVVCTPVCQVEIPES